MASAEYFAVKLLRFSNTWVIPFCKLCNLF